MCLDGLFLLRSLPAACRSTLSGIFLACLDFCSSNGWPVTIPMMKSSERPCKREEITYDLFMITKSVKSTAVAIQDSDFN